MIQFKLEPNEKERISNMIEEFEQIHKDYKREAKEKIRREYLSKLQFFQTEFNNFTQKYKSDSDNEEILTLLFSIIKIKVRIYNLSKLIEEHLLEGIYYN